ncbi:tRNA (adenosine(37)-N6)-threonylcarbamoyltransferase complex ATPase subunit type 1 TsaE [Chitinasiproducens palmae]|uniref:tRNA threonylcarbamoyladenosine biosynthesis protein TsaE n=1 Tax=Chitinasiproducens palmae TaxID=1770053 RepID=A0A1H2PRC4_9BURK|nr:tRNA (adenosine(37)-N6)-threonylcarbamoyltransferase complex ATPase subunit type 1 TsaE [Chitinasiproducens palmae]SDV49442.1 tRNA threonylcarbamoyladenosine biosynthesis protein TsaE [Chitinasiproducens palmae]
MPDPAQRRFADVPDPQLADAPCNGAPAQLQRTFALADEAATQAFGAVLARACAEPATLAQGGCTIWLLGDLGAGKTTLGRALLHALGHRGRVRSPTYTLVEPYTIASLALPGWPLERALDVYHFDLYRFASPDEWFDSGFDEYLVADALRLIEWPQRAQGCLPCPDLALQLALAGDGRSLHAAACSEKGKRCLERC